MFDLKEYPLDYSKDVLEPYISSNTMNFHYDKHLGTYISNLNKLIKDTKFENYNLKKIIIESSHSKDTLGIFNNSAQVYNHNFFFKCLKKGDNAEFPKKLLYTFKSKEKFLEEFKVVANSVFGSGWVWLVKEAGEYKITKTSNADNPIAHNQTAILTLDLWEHAYYLDYQNRRADYIDNFVNNLINWEFVEGNL
ncbi:MAG: superoxide dismutase [Alphaproteobacteria bacterium]